MKKEEKLSLFVILPIGIVGIAILIFILTNRNSGSMVTERTTDASASERKIKEPGRTIESANAAEPPDKAEPEPEPTRAKSDEEPNPSSDQKTGKPANTGEEELEEMIIRELAVTPVFGGEITEFKFTGKDSDGTLNFTYKSNGNPAKGSFNLETKLLVAGRE